MTYHRHGLGADLETIGSAVRAAGKIAEDPYLPEVACHVLRLNQITTTGDPGKPCLPTIVSPDKRNKGVGLSAVVGPLRAFTWARTHPIETMGIGILVVGGIFLLGYGAGKRRGR